MISLKIYRESRAFRQKSIIHCSKRSSKWGKKNKILSPAILRSWPRLEWTAPFPSSNGPRESLPNRMRCASKHTKHPNKLLNSKLKYIPSRSSFHLPMQPNPWPPLAHIFIWFADEPHTYTYHKLSNVILNDGGRSENIIHRWEYFTIQRDDLFYYQLVVTKIPSQFTWTLNFQLRRCQLQYGTLTIFNSSLVIECGRTAILFTTDGFHSNMSWVNRLK